MKTLILFLIFSTIGYCLTDTEIVDCESDFEIKVKEKCEAIGSCTYNSKTKECFETHQCSEGDKDNCSNIVPKNFSFYKCVPSGTGTNFECKPKLRTCSEFNSMSNTIKGDITCPQLSSSNNGRHCLLDSNGYCQENYEQCSDINSESTCNDNIPKDLSTKCHWNSDDPSHEFCEPIQRDCRDRFYNENIDNCGKITVSDNTKKCIFIRTEGKCEEHFKSCEDIGSGEVCVNHKPLNLKQNGYNYTIKCVPDDSTDSVKKCKTEKKKCRDYYFVNLTESIPTYFQNILDDLSLQGIKFDETFCSQLDVSEDYYRCAFNEIHGCYEEFNTCEDYTKIVETDRACEDIVLLTQNQKCFYNNINDTCITRQIYHSCDEYKEGDKKTCESILSSENNKYCILDKDSECIEKPINCSEAYTKEDCLHIAKPSDSNKRCVWGNKGSRALIRSYSSDICYEEFLRCEDYNNKSDYGSNDCEYIKLYDGKICKSETLGNIDRCISQFKTCKDATTEEECKLIAKIGVADPERKVCDWYKSSPTSTGSCIENYKYCSDYRGNEGDKCTRIKPYDASGNNIDIGFKCINDEVGVGCQKVPLECKDAKNPVECTSFSDYIKDKEKQYCVYYGDKCTTQYKQCEDVDPYSSSCSTNIIEGYIINACSQKSDGKCERKNDQCSSFTKPKTTPITSQELSMDNYYKDLCHGIDPNCKYVSGNCKFEKKSCEETKFYSNETDNNKLICENIQVEKPYKRCVLKKDFSGCEEVYLETDYSTANTSYSTSPEATSQGNSSGFIVKGIHLIIVLLCLLI